MPLQSAPYNVNWIYSNNSNIHVAKHREWLSNCTPFDSAVGSCLGTAGMPIAVVGGVRLEVNTPSQQ